MNKIIQNMYLFSKLGVSLILFICLIGVLYILFMNYQKESQISKNTLKNDNQLQENIKKNSELIQEAINKINTYEKSLEDVKNYVKDISKAKDKTDLTLINKNIEVLNNSFKNLSIQIEELKKNDKNFIKSDKNNSSIADKSKKDIIELILLKYENNISIISEIEFLRKMSTNNEHTHLEKLLILSSNPFMGYEYLENTFDVEVNMYLKNTIVTSDSFFSKIILPYLNVSPTTENIVTSDLIIKIKNIKSYIQNKNIEKALVKLKTIEDYENIFKLSFLEIDKYINFKNELQSIN